MEVALMIEGQEDVTWEDWLALAGACEEHGVVAMFRSDHYLSVDDRRDRGSLDAWGTITALGAVTERLRLGTMVSPATFRHPAVLAKAAATADTSPAGGSRPGSVLAGGSASTSSTASSCRRSGRGWTRSRSRCRSSAATGPRGRRLRGQALLGAGTRCPAEAGAAPAPAADPRRQRRPAQPPPRCSLRGRVQHGDGDGRGDRRPAAPPRRGLRSRGPRSGDPAALDDDRLAGGRADRAELLDRASRLSQWKGQGDDGEAFLAGLRESTILGTVEEAVEQLRELEVAGLTRIMGQHLLHRDLDAVALDRAGTESLIASLRKPAI